MKISSFLTLCMILGVCYTTSAQKSTSKKFKNVDLIELKALLMDNLNEDDLIEEGESFYLTILEDQFKINGKSLSQEENERYADLLAPFNLGYGKERKIYVGANGIALGDFTKKGFDGIVDGSFKNGVLGGK